MDAPVKDELVRYFGSPAADVYLQRAADTLAGEGLDPVDHRTRRPGR